ncbi:hypothetical protein OSTOST_20652 [Ostertagia ostertagi]
MDVLGVFDGLCYSASREERADWQGAQRRCLDRGATLPMKITETAQRGLRAALKASTHQKDFYWIGATSSLTNWRWADGTVVASEEADWSGSSIQPSNRPEAIVLARVAEWKWIPSAQNNQNRARFLESATPGGFRSLRLTSQLERELCIRANWAMNLSAMLSGCVTKRPDGAGPFQNVERRNARALRFGVVVESYDY